MEEKRKTILRGLEVRGGGGGGGRLEQMGVTGVTRDSRALEPGNKARGLDTCT